MALFLMQEEKGSILPNRAANLAAETIIPPFWVFDLLTASKPVAAEPVVGVQFIILVIPVAGAVPVIRSSFGDHLHFSAGRTGKIRSRVVGGHAKLFQALYRSGYDCTWGSLKTGVVTAATLHVAGRGASVDHESVLGGTRSRNRATSQVS